MKNQQIDEHQAHWILYKMGKRVLRPGGKSLTIRMMKELNIQSTDDVVEFAPGTGWTAGLALKKHPKSYKGVELNEIAADKLRKKIHGSNEEIICANAQETGLPDASADKVYGEAMLTMHPASRKLHIIREARRLLRPGGYYAIHELAIVPEDLPEDKVQEITQGMSKVNRVNARPLTLSGWMNLLEEEGFHVIWHELVPMEFLNYKKVVEDEGILQTLKIGYNVITHPEARKRIFEVKGIFEKYHDNINAVSFIAQKK